MKIRETEDLEAIGSTPQVEGSQEDPNYPPETYRRMSWSALEFIHRPSSRPLAWVFYGILATILVGLTSTFFVYLDERVRAFGEIVADPGVLRILASTDGLMGTPLVQPGSEVAKGQVLGHLQMELEERQVNSILASLRLSVNLLERADRRTGLPRQLVEAQILATLSDDAVREASATLQAAVGRSKISLADPAQFESLRDRAIEATHRLRSALVGYLERHRLRAPGAGTLLQYQVSPNENMQAGQVVAIMLPRGARLVARLLLEPGDVPNVSLGQPTRHRLEAYPYQRYGVFEGEVISIEQAPQADGALLYEARTTVRHPATFSPELASTVRLVMGMRSSSEIITGRHTLYELAMDSFFGRR